MKSSFSLLLAYGTLRVSRSQNCHLFTPFFYLKPLAYMVLQIVLPLMIKHPSKLTEITAYTLSVLRIFVHSVCCHFSWHWLWSAVTLSHVLPWEWSTLHKDHLSRWPSCQWCHLSWRPSYVVLPCGMLLRLTTCHILWHLEYIAVASFWSTLCLSHGHPESSSWNLRQRYSLSEITCWNLWNN